MSKKISPPKGLKDIHEDFIKSTLPFFFEKSFINKNEDKIVKEIASRSSLTIEDHLMYHALKKAGIENTRYANGYSDNVFTKVFATSIADSKEALGLERPNPATIIDTTEKAISSAMNNIIGGRNKSS